MRVKFRRRWPTTTRTARSPCRACPDSPTNNMSGGCFESMARVYHSACAARAAFTSSRLRLTCAVSSIFKTISWLRRQTLSVWTETVGVLAVQLLFGKVWIQGAPLRCLQRCWSSLCLSFASWRHLLTFHDTALYMPLHYRMCRATLHVLPGALLWCGFWYFSWFLTENFILAWYSTNLFHFYF